MSLERNIDVRKQRNLTLRETFSLCVKGILHRLLRSLLTLAVVVLAVAFFMFLLSENVFVQSVGKGVRDEAAYQQFATRLLNYLYEIPTAAGQSRRLATAYAGSKGQLEEMASVVGWDRGRVEDLARSCSREQKYLRFFEEMAVGKRLILVEKNEGRKIFQYLQDSEIRERFKEAIQPMLDLRVPYTLSGFMDFIDAYPDFRRELDVFTDAWKQAVIRLTEATKQLTGGENLDAWLADSNSGQLAQWASLVRDYAFRLSENDISTVHDQVEKMMLKQNISQTLSSPEKRQLWRETFKERKRLSVEDKLLRLGDPRVAQILDHRYSAEQLQAVSDRLTKNQRLAALNLKLSGKIAKEEEGRLLSARQVFLLLISFVVCMVGIANAMLMSITERFREIATMKCLGATDRYILIQFMMEAALQGAAGGVLGLLLGFIVGAVKNIAAFGGYALQYWPGEGLVVSGALSLAVGILLAVLASIYPSWAASRMLPMEAMRVE